MKDKKSKWDVISATNGVSGASDARLIKVVPTGSIGIPAAWEAVTSPTVKVASPFYRFLTIPVSQVGHLIGPRGACITDIRRASGTDIKIDQPYGRLYATVAISGQGADVAERLIYEKLASAPGNSLHGIF